MSSSFQDDQIVLPSGETILFSEGIETILECLQRFCPQASDEDIAIGFYENIAPLFEKAHIEAAHQENMAQDFNPYHLPAGSTRGGQFTSSAEEAPSDPAPATHAPHTDHKESFYAHGVALYSDLSTFLEKETEKYPTLSYALGAVAILWDIVALSLTKGRDPKAKQDLLLKFAAAGQKTSEFSKNIFTKTGKGSKYAKKAQKNALPPSTTAPKRLTLAEEREALEAFKVHFPEINVQKLEKDEAAGLGAHLLSEHTLVRGGKTNYLRHELMKNTPNPKKINSAFYSDHVAAECADKALKNIRNQDEIKKWLMDIKNHDNLTLHVDMKRKIGVSLPRGAPEAKEVSSAAIVLKKTGNPENPFMIYTGHPR